MCSFNLLNNIGGKKNNLCFTHVSLRLVKGVIWKPQPDSALI